MCKEAKLLLPIHHGWYLGSLQTIAVMYDWDDDPNWSHCAMCASKSKPSASAVDPMSESQPVSFGQYWIEE